MNNPTIPTDKGQQTAVDWLMQLWDKYKCEGEKMSWHQIIETTNLAKEKEEEQIKQAYNQGYREGQQEFPPPNSKDVSQFSNAQFYFTETYHSKKLL